MLTVGKKGSFKTVVTEENTAKTMQSGSLLVFATPALAAAMEAASVACIGDALEPGSTTVGTALNLQHTAATPLGMAVTAEAELTEIDGRKLSFQIVARDETGVIGKAEHTRFIVDAERFMKKTNEKGRESC